MHPMTEVRTLFFIFSIICAVFLHPAEGGPGTLQFVMSEVTVSEGIGVYKAQVERVNGADGEVSCRVMTSSRTATYNVDYAFTYDRATWADKETGIKTVDVTIKEDKIRESSEYFMAMIYERTGGASEGPNQKVIIADNEDDGEWTAWGSWTTPCQAQCESPGTRTRTRSCFYPRPQNKGRICQGPSSDTEKCASTLKCDDPVRCQKKSPKGYLPDPLDAKKFYQCQEVGTGHIIHHMDCAGGAEWNQADEECSKHIYDNSKPTGGHTGGYDCVNSNPCKPLAVPGKNFYPHVKKSKFVQCGNGICYVQTCGSLQWDPEKNICVRPT